MRVVLLDPGRGGSAQAELVAGTAGFEATVQSAEEFLGHPPEETAPAALLLDLRAEAGPGLDVVRRVRDCCGYGPGILALTGKGEGAIALRAGADSVLDGPISPELLGAALRSLGRRMKCP